MPKQGTQARVASIVTQLTVSRGRKVLQVRPTLMVANYTATALQVIHCLL